LEDYIFAYCYDDPATPGDDIAGNIYWVREGTSPNSWTLVKTPDIPDAQPAITDPPIFKKEGHIQITEWEGHLYISLEPYDKEFTPNANDINVLDPDTYPPVKSNRVSLKKLYLEWDNGSTTPCVTNAQLPKASIHPYIVDDDGVTTETWGGTLANNWHGAFYYSTLLFRVNNGVSGAWDAANDAQLRIISDSGFTERNVLYNDHPRITYEVLLGAALTVTAAYSTAGAFPGGRIELSISRSVGGVDTFQELVDAIDAALDALAVSDERFKDIKHSVFIGDNAEPGTKVQISQSGAVVPADNSNYINNYAGTTLQEDGGENGWGWYPSFKEEKSATDNMPALYTFTFFAREQYVALVEGTPRTFIFDGPIAQVQLGALDEIGAAAIGGVTQFSRRAYPITGAFSRVVEDFDTGLWDWNKISGIFARTERNGTESYVEAITTPGTWINRLYGGGAYPPIDSNPTLFDATNGTASKFRVNDYHYRLNDAVLRQKELVYFSGNQRSYTSLPQGPYYFDVVNQTGYYGNILNLSTRVYQSLPSVPHATAFDFFLDFDEPITGINHFLEKPIVFTAISTWRLEGKKGADGRGAFFSRVISNEFGCIANQSIVRTNIGIFFWSRQGVVYTDGLRAFRVNEHLLKTYQTWLDNTRTSDSEIGTRELRGTYDEIDQRIMWSALDAEGFPIWVFLDLRQGLSQTMCFQTGKGNTLRLNYGDTGGSNNQLAVPMFQTNATLYSEETSIFYRAQGKRLLRHNEDDTYDEFYFDTALLNGVQASHFYQGVNQNLRNPIHPLLKSVGYHFGSKGHRKWTSMVMVNMRDQTQLGVSFQPLGWDDLADNPHKLATCLNYQHLPFSLDYANSPAADVQQFFAHQDCQVNNTRIASFKRRFPRGRIRNTYKQFGFRQLPIYTARIQGSQVDPNANPASNAITVTYKDGLAASGVDWVEILMKFDDYFSASFYTDLGVKTGNIWFVKWGDGDDWVRIHDVVLVTGQPAPTENHIKLTVSWPQASIASDQVQQVDYIDLARVPTDQVIELLDYTLTYTVIGDRTHGLFKRGNGADNGDTLTP
jgi:hypothetical protein